LKTVLFKTWPNGRTIIIDYRDGVKNWAMRLGDGETGLQVSQIRFLRDEEGESSSEEEEPDVEPKLEEEEEEEEAMDTSVPVKNGKKKGKGRGRGRPKGTTKAAIIKARAVTPKKQAKKQGPLELKLNGVLVKGQEDQEGSWMVDLCVGSNVVEVGETSGLVWKAYVERMEET
jgi:chromatin structure-remodeling complex subunit RSC4